MKKRQIQDIAAAALFALATTGIVGAEGTDAKASSLLAKLRESLGGEARLASVKGLSSEADLRRVLPGEGAEPGPELSGDIKFDIADPKRYLFIDSFSPMPGMPPISIGSALDGDNQWSGPMSAPMAGVMIRAGGADDPARLRARLEKDMARLSVALLAGSNLPGMEFTYGGTAESPDGRAEVLDVKGPGGFKGKLFLDEKTARPMMLVYQEIPRRLSMRRGSPGATPPSTPDLPGHGAPGAAPAPEMKEAQMFLSDYKSEGGVSLPRSITIKVQDGATEEWTVQGEKGEAVISGVGAGEHRVRVTVQGFEPWEKKVRVRDGRATFEAKLKLAKLAEDVSVTSDDSRSAALDYKTTLISPTCRMTPTNSRPPFAASPARSPACA